MPPMPSIASAAKSPSVLSLNYSYGWHHTGPAPPGHQPFRSGLLPAFNGNTKPLQPAVLGQISLQGRAVGTHGDDSLDRSSRRTSRQAPLPPPASRSLRRAPIATS